ncbi:MAG: gluconate 2-dehydrogenase subunit 3 family protein [Magnetospirillum sp.]|nr:gluconate 2-dehydrogenase subunit 3 family protein [Magnetospirillum sp.]
MAARLDRRHFLKAATAGAALAAAVPVAAQGRPEAATAAHPPHVPTDAPPDRARLFLTDDEAAFLTALIDVMIPADEVGPSGAEAGVVAYMDGQLAGAWGNGARMYLGGPWGEGTPQQGYQLPLTPAQLVRAAIPEMEKATRDAGAASFAEMPADKRNDFLAGVEAGDIGLATLPGRVIMSVLQSMVVEGYFADPAYGGNRDMAAWRMIGFPGARGAYVDDIEASRGKPFQTDPVSLADLQ